METKKLSGLQLELLKVYSFEPSPNDLEEIKQMLAKFFANKLVNNVQNSIEEKNITDNDLENWLNGTTAISN
jgi:hypothetical protein